MTNTERDLVIEECAALCDRLEAQRATAAACAIKLREMVGNPTMTRTVVEAAMMDACIEELAAAHRQKNRLFSL